MGGGGGEQSGGAAAKPLLAALLPARGVAQRRVARAGACSPAPAQPGPCCSSPAAVHKVNVFQVAGHASSQLRRILCNLVVQIDAGGVLRGEGTFKGGERRGGEY